MKNISIKRPDISKKFEKKTDKEKKELCEKSTEKTSDIDLKSLKDDIDNL